jgi:hypothetical protein
MPFAFSFFLMKPWTSIAALLSILLASSGFAQNDGEEEINRDFVKRQIPVVTAPGQGRGYRPS